MFSSQVIIAIEVLQALDRPIGTEGARSERGVDLSDYLAVYKMQKSLFRQVLKRLVQSKHIAQTSGNKYILQITPADITVMQLVQLFHGDLCLGETYAHKLTYGRENYRSTACRNFQRYELKMYRKIYGKLALLPISKFWKRNTSDCVSALT